MKGYILKIVNINTEALNSRSFNSILWTDEYLKNGISSNLLVLRNNLNLSLPYVSSYQKDKTKVTKLAEASLRYLQYRYGFQNKFSVTSKNLFDNTHYKQADLVHLHLVNPSSDLTLKNIKTISRDKPLVWTWHDPWVLTGHCVYPGRCQEWTNSCKKCPDLTRNFAVKKDRTFQNRLEKFDLLSKLDVQIHLCSDWMKNLVIKSGINLRKEPQVVALPSQFKIESRQDARKIFRSQYKISDHQVVLGFRDTPLFQKGVRSIENILIDLAPYQNLVIVSLDATNTAEQFKNKFRVIELGYVGDAHVLSEFYSGIDLFLTFATEEAYGVMVAESISMGTPVLTLKNTGSAEIVDKFGGVTVSKLEDALTFLNSILLNTGKGHAVLQGLVNKSKLFELGLERFTVQMKSIYQKTIE